MRVLVIDHDAETADLLAELLEEKGCVAHAAADPGRACELIATWHPDVVVLDSMIIGGPDPLIRKLRRHRRHARIALYTADRDAIVRLVAESAVDEAFLKPYTEEILVWIAAQCRQT